MAGGTAGALATTFKAFVRAVGHGLPGANGFCWLLPSERRAGRRGRPGSCPGLVPTSCRVAAPRQVGSTWAFWMPSNGHTAMAPAGEGGAAATAHGCLLGHLCPLTSCQAVAPLLGRGHSMLAMASKPLTPSQSPGRYCVGRPEYSALGNGIFQLGENSSTVRCWPESPVIPRFLRKD